MTLVETARAKVNVTLRVLGRRADGYHELDSLVAFADVGDGLTATPADGFTFLCDDPALANADNLVARAAAAWAQSTGAAPKLQVSLEKRLPVAAGIGGGSADAAAAIRLFERASQVRLGLAQRHEIAKKLGADVHVCLASRAARMRGIGDVLEPMTLASPLVSVLVNPRCAVPATKTAEVFRRLAAPQLTTLPVAQPVQDIAAAIRLGRNDLETPAAQVMPAIRDVLAALQASGADVARLSGAGPTCFALYANEARAAAAATALRQAHPTWWIVATLLR